jgi:hypothetical protein
LASQGPEGAGTLALAIPSIDLLDRSAVGCGDRRRADSAGLADLIEYRRLVEAVPEWPLDPSLRARFLLYLVLPLGSWLGGALVERLIDVALD